MDLFVLLHQQTRTGVHIRRQLLSIDNKYDERTLMMRLVTTTIYHDGDEAGIALLAEVLGS